MTSARSWQEIARSIIRTRHPKLDVWDIRGSMTGDWLTIEIHSGKEVREVGISLGPWSDEHEAIDAIRWVADDLAGWHRLHVPFRIGHGRLRGYMGHHRQLKSTLPPGLT